LLVLAAKNARLLLDEKLIQKKMFSERMSKMVLSLKEELKLANSPRTMVCFDISNTGETDAVGSGVYFDNGKPKKGEYRHFKIKGVKGQDDFKMMREVVGRYFHRLKEENKQPPDLVIVDGGKGQLSNAQEELESLGFKDQTIISLAKRLEEVYVPGLSDPITIPKASPALMLLKRIRDEAHRFAITYNRKVRTLRTIKSALDDIPGVGPAKRQLLLTEFGSVERIRQMSIEELSQLKGITPKLAEAILQKLAAAAS
jgi:excinuclease ABC subunit C